MPTPHNPENPSSLPGQHPEITIRGVDVDPQGRCAHYHGHSDVVAHRCSTCNGWWACYYCHSEVGDHELTSISVNTEEAVLCGACRTTLSYVSYSQSAACPACGHPFNPNCAKHHDFYFHSEGA